MNFNLKITSLVLASSIAISASANEPRVFNLEDRQFSPKIGIVNQTVPLLNSQQRIRDFEPKDPEIFIRPGLMNKSVSFSFPVTNKMVMDFTEKQAHSQSRQYRMNVTGAELRQGIELKTTAPGALVRISGFNTNSPVEPQNLNLVVANQKFAKGSAFDTLVDSRMMSKTGVGFQRGTTGFKISEQVGQGNFKLQTQQNLNDSDRYLINVFEKNSDVELHLTANKSSYTKGGLMQVNTSLWANGQKHALNAIKTKLIAPNGQQLPVMANKSGQLQLPMNMSASNIPGALWTLETEVEAMVDGQLAKRVAKVAFAYGDKTASLTKIQPRVMTRGPQLASSIPVQATKAGRYEVRAVLYATNNNGQMVPAMVTHSANDLNPGMGIINMQFDKSLLAASGLKAPFEVRNIQLRDQKQMTVLD